jgi:hypothetical protein
MPVVPKPSKVLKRRTVRGNDHLTEHQMRSFKYSPISQDSFTHVDDCPKSVLLGKSIVSFGQAILL